MTLPFDKARCAGRMDFEPDGQWCEQRDTCSRYLAFTQWDRKAGLENYRGVLVVMAARDCKIKIEAPEAAQGGRNEQETRDQLLEMSRDDFAGNATRV